MSKNKFYAYSLTEEKSRGITQSWNDCKSAIEGKKAKYKGFRTEQEARQWLLDGAEYTKKAVLQQELKPGIYFDAGTGRGIGVEVKVTDARGNNIINKIVPASEINEFGNYLAPKGSTNNYGELMGCYIALKIALQENSRSIFGDSKLVIDYWSRGHIKKDKVAEKTYKLSLMVAELRRQFERNGGQILHVSGDINPADLGFHK